MKEAKEVDCNDSLKMPRNRSKHAAQMAADLKCIQDLKLDADQMEAELIDKRRKTEEFTVLQLELNESKAKIVKMKEEKPATY